MKKILIPSLLVCSLFASEQNYIELGGGVVRSKDNFSTGSNERISSLKSAKEETEGVPYLDLFYAYDITKNANIYINYSDDLRFGSNIDTKIGSFDFGVKYNSGKEWKNPFETGVKRDEIDVYEIGVYGSYEFSIGENYTGKIKHEISSKNYDDVHNNDNSLPHDLKREGTRNIFSFENSYSSKLFDKDVTYMGNILYENYDADGEASSYDKYVFQVGLSSELNEKWSLSFLTEFGKKEYGKYNAYVNKEVDADLYGIEAVLKWDKPFDYENVYVNFAAGHSVEEANANFYDKENTFSVISIGYRF